MSILFHGLSLGSIQSSFSIAQVLFWTPCRIDLPACAGHSYTYLHYTVLLIIMLRLFKELIPFPAVLHVPGLFLHVSLVRLVFIR